MSQVIKGLSGNEWTLEMRGSDRGAEEGEEGAAHLLPALAQAKALRYGAFYDRLQRNRMKF
jgi:hypothetical protein